MGADILYLTVLYLIILSCVFLRIVSFSVYSFKNAGAIAGIGVSILAAGIAVTGVMSVMSI